MPGPSDVPPSAGPERELRGSVEELERALAESTRARDALLLENARLASALERAARAREETLAMVSHDLRSPLSAMLLGVQRLERLVDGPGQDPALAAIGKLERSIRAMGRLIDLIVDLGRLQGGTLRLDRVRVSVEAIVASGLEPLAPLIAERSQRLSIHVDPALALASWDAERLARAIAILAGNVVARTPQGAALDVRAERNDGDVQIVIRGLGATAPELAPPGVANSNDGWPRGELLAAQLAVGIVEAHGGHVRTETGDGDGARIVLRLPADRCASNHS